MINTIKFSMVIMLYRLLVVIMVECVQLLKYFKVGTIDHPFTSMFMNKIFVQCKNNVECPEDISCLSNLFGKLII